MAGDDPGHHQATTGRLESGQAATGQQANGQAATGWQSVSQRIAAGQQSWQAVGPVRQNGTVPATIRVDLHCHSDASDGYYPPETVAACLAGSGATYVSLTDHQSIAGLQHFHEAAVRYGLTAITGVELHASHDGCEIHLLAYGFDHNHPGMDGLFKHVGSSASVLEAVHAAGGLVFLAHPLQLSQSESGLEELIKALARLGLDGIEAFYKSYDVPTQERLAAMADRLGLLTCAGSDFHGPAALVEAVHGHQATSRQNTPGTDMPIDRWKQFRMALGDHARMGLVERSGINVAPLIPLTMLEHFNWKRLLLQIALPALLVLVCFMVLLFAVMIPGFEASLLAHKREMTKELTNSAWSILQDFHQDVGTGLLSLEDAQLAAMERIRRMRYGPDGKDYFWLSDMQPRMVMHPYRRDLEGIDLTDLADPSGVRPFVEFVRLVQLGSSGFVRYVWQWLDDPDRLMAKESYVRGFQPWGWIIGTGLYVDDVQREIAALTGRLIDAAMLVVILTGALLMMLSYQGYRSERRRSDAERALRHSHERYRALVESSASATLLLLDGRGTYANAAMLEMSGYSAPEIAFLDIYDLITTAADITDQDDLAALMEGNERLEPFEARLTRKDGRTVPILLSATALFHSGRQGLLLNAQDLTRQRIRRNASTMDQSDAQWQASLSFLMEPVHKFMDRPRTCPVGTSIRHAARLMGKQAGDALAVTGSDGEPLGIVTDYDFRGRVVATHLDPDSPVSRIMSAPVATIAEHAPLFEALLDDEDATGHLVVVDGCDRPTGMLHTSRAIRLNRFAPAVLSQRIARADHPDELAEIGRRIPALVISIFDSGIPADTICHLTAAMSENITRRLIQLALAEFGPPPGRFAFVALGSEARQEQTLATDQDNAIIYQTAADDPDKPPVGQPVADYYLALGSFVCEGLAQAGYRPCRGGNMASNPLWNQPLSVWQGYFSDWFREPDGNALSHCKVFFDWRFIHGDATLTQTLRRHINLAVADQPSVLAHLALDAMRYKPPVGLFGRIITDSAAGRSDTFDIKEAVLPFVDYARLHALKHGLEETNTSRRLQALCNRGVIQEADYRETAQAGSYLLGLRLRHQISLIKDGNMADNCINPDTLTGLEVGMLKHIFARISTIQKSMSLEFQAYP
jgi:PAS domain S-box-containing protein